MARMGAYFVFFLLAYCPMLYSSQDLIYFNQPFQKVPDEEDPAYFFERCLDVVEGELNYQKNKLKSVEIIGKLIVVKKGHFNKIYERYHDSNDVEKFSIYAEKLVIGSPFRLPQTNIEIYAKEMIFDDSSGELAYISTVPLSIDTRPVSKPEENNYPNFKAADGRNGLVAGKMIVMINTFHNSGGTITRFRLMGGNGQPAGYGLIGPDGDSYPALPVEQFGDRWIIKTARGGCLPINPTNAAYAKNALFYRARFLGASDEIIGTETWPTNGNDSKPGGIPGEGGSGGDFVTNLNIAPYVNVDGGRCGEKAPDIEKGGAAGLPNPAYHIYCLGGADGSYYKENSQRDGKKATSPSAKSEKGDSGQISIDSKSMLAWLRPQVLETAVRYAEDLYLVRYYQKADSILTYYADMLNQVLQNADTTKLSEQGLSELKALYNRIKRLKFQLNNGLDYFGRPFAWVPVLSMEVYKNTFMAEVNHLGRQLYLAHWLGNSMEKAEQRSTSIQKSISALKDAITIETEEYNNILKDKLPSLRNTINRIQLKQKYIFEEIKLREQALIAQAIDNAKGKKRKENLLQGLKIITAIVSIVPVGQPYAGLIWGSIESIAKNEDITAIAKNMIDSCGDLQNTDIEMGSFIDSLKNADFSSPDKVLEFATKNKKTLSKLTSTADSILINLAKVTNHRIPDSEVQSEIDKLKESDTYYKELLIQVEELNNDKMYLFIKLEEIKQRILYILEDINYKMNTITQLAAELRQKIKGYDNKTKLLIDEMRRRAEDRLKYYHYHFAKAYEYRLMTPFKNELLLSGVYKKCNDMVEANQIELTDSQVESMLFPYFDQLRNIVFSILFRYESQPIEKQLQRTVIFDKKEIDMLNKGMELRVLLAKREEFLKKGEENLRIINIRANKAKSKNKTGSIDIVVKHGGTSIITKGGCTYIFKHLGSEGQMPIQWKSVYDITNNTIYHARDSDTNASLLYALLGENNNKIELFARPGLDATILISVKPQPQQTKLASLSLIIDYSYTSTEL